ncbi:hypothetical protein PVAP13_3NG298976 [Panicum virgatum]|uniref:Uncharacterized protein n=1 Tax=Panicum virgatum TaxID=38727 RepID=A0A8T0UMK6_PANVG|nr:hypothetical protein PVAP13_3NG298976 [Panicum virgatum]
MEGPRRQQIRPVVSSLWRAGALAAARGGARAREVPTRPWLAPTVAELSRAGHGAASPPGLGSASAPSRRTLVPGVRTARTGGGRPLADGTGPHRRRPAPPLLPSRAGGRRPRRARAAGGNEHAQGRRARSAGGAEHARPAAPGGERVQGQRVRAALGRRPRRSRTSRGAPRPPLRLAARPASPPMASVVAFAEACPACVARHDLRGASGAAAAGLRRRAGGAWPQRRGEDVAAAPPSPSPDPTQLELGHRRPSSLRGALPPQCSTLCGGSATSSWQRREGAPRRPAAVASTRPKATTERTSGGSPLSSSGGLRRGWVGRRSELSGQRRRAATATPSVGQRAHWSLWIR